MPWESIQPLQQLKPAHEIVAMLEARGCNDTEICEATGYSMGHISRIRHNAPGYAVCVSEFKNEIQGKAIDETVDAIDRFNGMVPKMADNIENLALHANKEGVRLRATMDILDRAPDAPKRVHRQENLEERKIIFGVQVVENMRKALTDVGADEVVDLLEGEDFTTEEGVINVDDD
jgi:hypothetical protein